MNSNGALATLVSEETARVPLFTVVSAEDVQEEERHGPVRALPMTKMDWIDFEQVFPGTQSPLNDF